MGLKAQIKDLSEVDEKHRDLYVKNDDGTYRLDAEGVEDIAALKNALSRERELNKKKGEDGLSKAEKEELKQLREEREKAEEKKLQDEKNYQGLEQRLKEKHTKELTAEQERAKKATEALHKTLRENAATQAIVKHKGRVAPLLPHVVNKLAVVEENGEHKVVVLDKDGNPRYSKENPKDVMSVDDLVSQDFLNNEDFMGVFEGKGSSGSGTIGGSGGGRQGGAFTISQADARDASKYQAAKANAVKAGGTLSIVP